MELPLILRRAVEKECAGYNAAELVRAAEELSKIYRGVNPPMRRGLTPVEAAAYSAARMPATYAAVYSAMKLSFERYDKTKIASVLDAGAGSGAAAWAALEMFGHPERLTCAERDPSMFGLGRKFMSEADQSGAADWILCDIAEIKAEKSADLVVASYVFNEIGESARARNLEKLWSMTKKILLIVEPGTPACYKEILFARDRLLASGGHILAPCPRESACGLPEGDWCHFSARAARSRLQIMLKGGEAPYEDEKYCFLAVSKEPADRCESRVLRHPEIRPGYVRLRLCGKDFIKTEEIGKSGRHFKAARKSDAGDEFPPRGQDI